MQELSLRVNGQEHTVDVDPSTPLLYVLRNQLALNGPKFGCGLEQCGACMVLIDGAAEPSCRLPVVAVQDRAITTLEGLVGDDGTLHPVQEAFVQEQAAQCGFCVNGMILSAVALLDETPDADRETINERLHDNLCRCGTHARFLRAIRRAADAMQS
jgi:nicotinate dehydrogenase subunit A